MVLRVHVVERAAVFRNRAGAVLRRVEAGRPRTAHHAHRRRLVDNGGLVAGVSEGAVGLAIVVGADHGRHEGGTVRGVVAGSGDGSAVGALGEEAGAVREIGRGGGGGGHGVLAHVESEASLGVDAQVVGHVGLLRNRSVYAWCLRRAHVGRSLDVERRHGLVLEHGKVNGTGDGAGTLALVTMRRTHGRVHLADAPLVLIGHHAHVGGTKVGLGRRARDGRDGSRGGDGVGGIHGVGAGDGIGHVAVSVVAVHEGLERDELGELAAQDLGVAAEVVDHAGGGLGVFGKVANLVEAAGGGGRVHEEVGGVVELDDDAAELGGVAFAVFEVDVLDVSKGVLDLVAGLVVVDVVGHGALVGGVEDDEVHGVLTDTRPLADAEGTAGQVVNEDLAGTSLLAEEHVAVAKGDETGAAEIASAEAFARLHGLHGEIGAHGFGDGVNVLAGFEALFGEQLNLGASVLEPDLDGAFRHVDLVSDAVADAGCGRGVLVELDLEGGELVLGGALTLLVLLLLSEGALARRTLGEAGCGLAAGGGGGGRSLFRGGARGGGRAGAGRLGGLMHGHHGDGHLDFGGHDGEMRLDDERCV